MSWSDLRAVAERAIATYEAAAVRLAGRLSELDELRTAIAGSLRGSESPLTEQALAQLTATRQRLAQAHDALLTAADHGRRYLATVDPDAAGGSVTGLPGPQSGPVGRGGHKSRVTSKERRSTMRRRSDHQPPKQPSGHQRSGLTRSQPHRDPSRSTARPIPTPRVPAVFPPPAPTPLPVPPARQALTDVSRRRTHVFTEQGPAGLADLRKRDNGLVALRLGWLDAGGHARLRHGADVSERRLQERVMYGRDPITGTTTDWEHGGGHRVGRHATAFTDNTALVFAEMRIWDNPECRAKRERAEANNDDRFTVRLPAASVLGPQFRDYIHGWSRVGDRKHPLGAAPTTFPDDTELVAIYRRDAPNEQWRLYRCYPTPPARMG